MGALISEVLLYVSHDPPLASSFNRPYLKDVLEVAV
jgi:hypothetical protein